MSTTLSALTRKAVKEGRNAKEAKAEEKVVVRKAAAKTEVAVVLRAPMVASSWPSMAIAAEETIVRLATSRPP